MNPKIATRRVSLLLLLFIFCASGVVAQTTSFTYQGRLSDGGTPANGTYDLRFALWDSNSGGTQIGEQTVPTVAVSAGIFTVQLDFGATAFPGANRFLEIGARLTGAASFTILSPRQQITSTPYAIRSLNASSADAVTVTGVPGGSGNYIQNATTQQASANFNISGNGTAVGTLSSDIVNAATRYNLGGSRILSAPGSQNLFAGLGAGEVNTGDSNSFFGFQAGQENTTGGGNSFLGRRAGMHNNTGEGNSFYGNITGLDNTSGEGNSFFGNGAGSTNTTGFNNSFFGVGAGGQNNGSTNTAIGSYANVGAALTNATAVGANAQVTQSNALVLGSVAGVNGAPTSVNVGIGTTAPLATLDTRGTLLVSGNVGIGTTAPLATLDTRGTLLVSGNVGIGTTAPTAKLDLRVNSALIRFSGVDCGPNFGAITFGNVALGCSNYSLLGEGVNTFINRPTGGVITFRENNSEQMVIQSGGNVVINGRGEFGGLLKLDQIDSGLGAGTVQLCRNAANVIAVCTSSSLRYKQQIVPFSGGLGLIRRLRPISFTWKTDGSRDLGLGAEDVAKVEPLLVTHNDKGEIEGVRYDRLNVILINAVKQQQDQIEQQQKQMELQQARYARQQQQIASLKRLVCLNHPRAGICK